MLVPVQLGRLVAPLLPSTNGWAQRVRLQQLRSAGLCPFRRRPISLLLPSGKFPTKSRIVFHNIFCFQPSRLIALLLTGLCREAHCFGKHWHAQPGYRVECFHAECKQSPVDFTKHRLFLCHAAWSPCKIDCSQATLILFFVM